ncbi:auxin-responsive protein SAUR71-like [Zingiber officinale]|uniref:auxin-responsive protein SAUR71-like n=1 Tax=Zingiber officinale TaxID=94328 RepID=UPI001C4C1FA1|nr:auxin-responsive protein SAUR71-like [Zingiber officinale]
MKVVRGHVPVLVGKEDGALEKFDVHVRAFKDPCMVTLLELAAQEFGLGHRGVLRIPCDVDHFRRMLEAIYSKCNCCVIHRLVSQF